MALASKWADDPELVKKAEEQDSLHKAVTVKKGQPLVSKWATADEPETPSPARSQTMSPGEEDKLKAIRERQAAKKKNKAKESSPSPSPPAQQQQRAEPNALAERLGMLSLKSDKAFEESREKKSPVKKSPKKNKKTPKRQVLSGDEWEDVTPGEDDDRASPTKAAQDFASRLGISLTPPTEKPGTKQHSPRKDKEKLRKQREQERLRNREKKSQHVPEWDSGKPGSKVDYSLEKKKPESKKQSTSTAVVADLSAELKLLEDIENGKKLDWSALDDDGGFSFV